MAVNLLIGALISAILGILALAGGSILWAKTRPKKKTWYANIYRVSEGVRLQKDGKGKFNNVKLKDLIATRKDIAEEIEQKPGITVWRLQSENKALPPITEEYVTYWGDGRKEVDVLAHEGNYTLLKKGYDKEAGEMIFKPIPIDDINMLESNIALKKERFKEKKDILEAISPFVTALIIGLVITTNTYLVVSGWKYTSDKFEEGSIQLTNTLNSIGGYAEQIESIRSTGKTIEQLKKETNSTKSSPPLIEDLG